MKKFLSRKFLVAVAGIVGNALGVDLAPVIAAVYVAAEGVADAVGALGKAIGEAREAK